MQSYSRILDTLRAKNSTSSKFFSVYRNVEGLAIELRQTWLLCQKIDLWQKRQMPRINCLVQEGHFKWKDVASALNKANIAHETGKPWTGKMLLTKVIQVRAELLAQRRCKYQFLSEKASSNPVISYKLFTWLHSHFRLF